MSITIILLYYLPFLISSQSSITSLLNLPSDFTSFLTKFQSQSCLIDVFQKYSFDTNCDNLPDEVTAAISYDLTICSYTKIGKTHPICSSKKVYDCLKLLEGDLWTTYITYSQHINNLCFYYKTQIWEKSSQFILEKLVNSSVGILSDLRSSSEIAKDIFKSHEKFAVDLKKNISFTLKKIDDVNEFFDNYTKTEEKIKNHLSDLEEKLNKNKIQIETAVHFFEDKLSYLSLYHTDKENSNPFTNVYKFYGCLILSEILIYLLLLDTFSMLFLLDILFILYEIFILNKVISVLSYIINIEYIVTASRISYIAIIAIVVMMNNKYTSRGRIHCHHNYYNSSNTKLTITEVKNYLTVTPIWVKKYISKVSPRNQSEMLMKAYKEMKDKMICN